MHKICSLLVATCTITVPKQWRRDHGCSGCWRTRGWRTPIAIAELRYAEIASAQSRTLAGRCLHGYEAHCYMNSIHVCPNIDHVMACK